jgi:hypothetical protein
MPSIDVFHGGVAVQAVVLRKNEVAFIVLQHLGWIRDWGSGVGARHDIPFADTSGRRA